MSQPGEMENKFLRPHVRVLHRVSMSRPLGWLRGGFLPWISERRSPIRQREGGSSASRKSCPRRPKAAFYYALHSQHNKKGAAAVHHHLISIRQTQIIHETKWRERKMYRELISHTTSRSKENESRRTACPAPDENRALRSSHNPCVRT